MCVQAGSGREKPEHEGRKVSINRRQCSSLDTCVHRGPFLPIGTLLRLRPLLPRKRVPTRGLLLLVVLATDWVLSGVAAAVPLPPLAPCCCWLGCFCGCCCCSLGEEAAPPPFNFLFSFLISTFSLVRSASCFFTAAILSSMVISSAFSSLTTPLVFFFPPILRQGSKPGGPT